MTVTFFDREPDRITSIGESRDRGYVFQFFEPGKGDVIGAYHVAVYSPRGSRQKWCAVKFYRVSDEANEVVSQRDLTEKEVVLFGQRVKVFEQAATS